MLKNATWLTSPELVGCLFVRAGHGGVLDRGVK